MLDKTQNALVETAGYLLLALKALAFWRRDSPVTSVEQLTRFAETRSKFVAQTTLFGYVRTRAGTRYASLVEDDVFARSLKIAQWEIYLACLCDLSLYAAATVSRRANGSNDETAALAARLLDTVVDGEETPEVRPQGFEDIRSNFRDRVDEINWDDLQDPEALFRGSVDALVEWAPIADELKTYDVRIVQNSMRNKWKRIRDRFDSSLDPDAVMMDWRAAPRGGPG